MITAFQRNGFQDDAFQIGLTVGGGGERWTGLHLLWLQAKELEAKRKREEEEALAAQAVEAVAVEVVEARAAPIVTDLAALRPVEALAPPIDLAKQEADELDAFMRFMIKLAQSEELEC